MNSSPLPAPTSRAPANRSAGPARPRRRWLRWAIILGVLGLLVFGLWPQPVPVEVAVAGRGDVVATVDEEGMTRVKNRYIISAPVGGQMHRIDWKPGAPVVAGETVLTTIESGGADFLDARGLAQAEARVRGAQAAVEMAQAQAERARAAHQLARSDLERYRALAERQAISAQEQESAVMREATAAQEQRAAAFAAQVAEFELQQARAALLRGTARAPVDPQTPLPVTSPVSGRLLRVFQESARLVPAGLPLLEVGDPVDLELRIEVLSRDGVAIRPGARVIVEQWGGAEPLQARVRLVEPSAFTKISALGVEEQRVYVMADFVDPIERRPTLGDSYRIEGRVVVWEGRNVLHVPAGALFQRGDRWQTFVVAGRRAALRTVKVGHTNGLETEIVDGLKEGERVVVYPGDKVADGSRVRELVVGTR